MARDPWAEGEDAMGWVQGRSASTAYRGGQWVGSLAAYKIPAATGAGHFPKKSCPGQAGRAISPLIQILWANYISQPPGGGPAQAQPPGAFPILLAEQFNLLSPPGPTKIIINVLHMD